jgi:streptogramin lyase
VSGTTTLLGGATCNIQVQFAPVTPTTVIAMLSATATVGGATDTLTLTSTGASPAHGTLREFPLPGNALAGDVAFGADGTIWFANFATNELGRMTPWGAVTEFTTPTPNAGTGRLTAGPDGNIWFTETSAARIGRITPAGIITEFRCPTTTARPFGITAGPASTLWVGYESATIARSTTAGTITEFPVQGASFTYGVAVGVDGNIWFTDTLGNIGRFVIATQAFTLFSVPADTLQPNALTSGPDGNIWYTNIIGGAVGRYNLTSGAKTIFGAPSGGSATQSIVAGPDNAVWVSVIDNRVLRVPITTGVVTITSVATQGAPGGITLGNDGNIWFAEGTLIGRITP